jgi:DNA-directed RNA polymerase specialized sigma24 family protein
VIAGRSHGIIRPAFPHATRIATVPVKRCPPPARRHRAISFVSSRHHLPGSEADDFGSHVKLKLIEHDYAILKKFEGRSNLRTYLTVVIHRLFLDYRIKAWGKWRPSAAAKRCGGVAILLERLTRRCSTCSGGVRAEQDETIRSHVASRTRGDRRTALLRVCAESDDAFDNLAH